MCSLRQKELTPDSVLPMSDQLCSNCPDTTGCKKYLQWLRLNPVKWADNSNDTGLANAVVFERPYYRSRSEEIFW